MQRNARLLPYANLLGAEFRLQAFHAQLAPNLTSFICAIKNHIGSYCWSVSSMSCLQCWQWRDNQITVRTDNSKDNGLFIYELSTDLQSTCPVSSWISAAAASHGKNSIQFYNHCTKTPLLYFKPAFSSFSQFCLMASSSHTQNSNKELAPTLSSPSPSLALSQNEVLPPYSVALHKEIVRWFSLSQCLPLNIFLL